MKKTLIYVNGILFISCALKAQKKSNYINDSIKQSKIEEIIITSSRTKEKLEDLSSTVHIINHQEIEEQESISNEITNILSYQVPGLAFGNNLVGNRGQTLRGRNVLIMIDGIPQSSPLRNNDREFRSIDPSVLGRIEVVKGATSIYGSGAEGGIINYITKEVKPQKKFSGKTLLGMTGKELFNKKMFTSKGGAGYRLTQLFEGSIGNFDYLVSGSFTTSGVKIDGEGLVLSPRYGLGETNMGNAFAKLRYSFDDKSKIEFMYNYYSSLQNSKYITEKGKYGVTLSTGKIGPRIGVKEGTKYNHNAYLKYINSSIFKNTSLNIFSYLQDFYTIYDYRKAPRWKTGGQSAILEKKYGFRSEFNTAFIKVKKLTPSLTYGIDLLNEYTTQKLIDGRIWVPKLNMLAFSPFIQSKLYIKKDLIVNMGIRGDLMKIIVPNYTTLPSGNDSPISVQGGVLKYNNLSYNLGIRYNAFSFFQLFTSYSSGFNIYDLGRVLRDAKSDVLQKINTRPVKVESYEIGFYSKIGKVLDFSSSYFYNYSKLGADLVSLNGFWTPLRAPQYINGVDVAMNIYPITGVNIGLNYTYQEGKVDVNNDNTYQKYLSGLRIAPPRLNSYIKWNSNNKKLSLGLYYMYSFKRNRFYPNQFGKYKEGEGPVKSFNLYNFQGSYKFNPLTTIRFGVENLFNKTYFPPTSMYTARDSEYVRGNGRYYTISINFLY